MQVDGGDGCVEPTRDTIADGSYPLSRTLYIYVNTDMAKSKPELKAFVDYYLSDAGSRRRCRTPDTSTSPTTRSTRPAALGTARGPDPDIRYAA